jgi:hypothetical protein
MSQVWGQILLNLEKDGSTVQLQHAILSPNFYIPAEKMHQSIITEKRTWSSDIHFSDFTVQDLLFFYADPNAKADELTDLEDEVFLFTPFDMMWSRWVHIVSVDFKPLEGTLLGDEKQIAYIRMIAVEPGILGGYVYNRAGEKVKDILGNYVRRRIRGLQ